MKSAKALFLCFSVASSEPSIAFSQTPGVITASAASAGSLLLAQAAGAGADYNKAEREKVGQDEQKQQQQRACMKACDSVGRSNGNVCTGYPLQAQGTCQLGVQKQTAACYQTCK